MKLSSAPPVLKHGAPPIETFPKIHLFGSMETPYPIESLIQSNRLHFTTSFSFSLLHSYDASFQIKSYLPPVLHQREWVQKRGEGKLGVNSTVLSPRWGHSHSHLGSAVSRGDNIRGVERKIVPAQRVKWDTSCWKHFPVCQRYTTHTTLTHVCIKINHQLHRS